MKLHLICIESKAEALANGKKKTVSEFHQEDGSAKVWLESFNPAAFPVGYHVTVDFEVGKKKEYPKEKFAPKKAEPVAKAKGAF